MAFIAKNPLSSAKLDTPPLAPVEGTRGIFPMSDGWYDIDDNDDINKLLTQKDIRDIGFKEYDAATLLAMYNEIDIIPSPEEWFVFSEETKTIISFNFDYQEEIEAVEELVIPYMINDILVENIGNFDDDVVIEAFKYPSLHYSYDSSSFLSVSNIHKVRLPNCIKKIGRYCFRSWDGMEDINLPTSCSLIEEYAFSDATSLRQVITPIRPNWELEIGDSVFRNSFLNNIDNLLDGIKTIPQRAFYGNIFVQSIVVPESVEVIEEDALQSEYGTISVLTILNKSCVLNHPFLTSEQGVDDYVFKFPKLIKGYIGSSAEAYAKKWNIPFASIEGSELATKAELEEVVSIDTEMSDTSTNAVQNNVIKAYVDGMVGDIETVLGGI